MKYTIARPLFVDRRKILAGDRSHCGRAAVLAGPKFLVVSHALIAVGPGTLIRNHFQQLLGMELDRVHAR